MARNNAKVTYIDGIRFDSGLESKFYLQLKEKKAAGEIFDFSLHPAFMLIGPFEYMGKKENGISYKADFHVVHNDNSTEIIEIKGMVERDFPLRLKLFKRCYPTIKITVLKECSLIDREHAYSDGFIELEKQTKLIAARKRARTNAKKKAKQAEKGNPKSKKG